MGQAKQRKLTAPLYGKVDQQALKLLRRAKATTIPKTVLIGYDASQQDFTRLMVTMSRLRAHGILTKDDALRILNGDYDVYNVALVPENGDALDHIDANTGLVIAFHLNMKFVSTEGFEQKSLPLYCYNRNNFDLYGICMKHGAKPVCWNEQPYSDDRSERLTPNEDDGPKGYAYIPSSESVAASGN